MSNFETCSVCGEFLAASTHDSERCRERDAEATTMESTYRVGCLCADGRRLLYRVDTGELIARVESDAGPSYMGDLSEAAARAQFPLAFTREAEKTRP